MLASFSGVHLESVEKTENYTWLKGESKTVVATAHGTRRNSAMNHEYKWNKREKST